MRLCGFRPPLDRCRQFETGNSQVPGLSSKRFTQLIRWILPVFFLASPCILLADDCIDYGECIQWLGSGHILVVDISIPGSPTVQGQVELPGPPLGMTLDGDLAFAAAREEGMVVIDISDLREPMILGQVDTPGIAQDVAVDGSFAYVANDYMGV